MGRNYLRTIESHSYWNSGVTRIRQIPVIGQVRRTAVAGNKYPATIGPNILGRTADVVGSSASAGSTKRCNEGWRVATRTKEFPHVGLDTIPETGAQISNIDHVPGLRCSDAIAP